MQSSLLVLFLLPLSTLSFSPSGIKQHGTRFPSLFMPPCYTETNVISQGIINSIKKEEGTRFALTRLEAKKPSKKEEFDPNLRSKLISESIAPWRTLRLFLYASLGSGAALGGFITLSGVAAALSGARTDVDLSAEYLNLGIDFGAVIAFIVLFKFDSDKGSELNENVEQKLERKKADRQISKAMKEREKILSELSLRIRVTDDGETRDALVQAIQEGANQHMIIVIGPRGFIRDSLLGAQLLKLDFAMRDVLVVPYEIGVTEAEKQMRPEGGFGDRPTWETLPFAAEIIGDGWDEYINSELADAVTQNGEKVKEDGIAIVVSNTGKIIRRGVGQVPWREMVNELEQKEKEEPVADLSFLNPGGGL